MDKTADRTSKALPLLGAALVLVVGGVHLQQYFEVLRFVPTVGTLFLANAAAAVGLFGYSEPTLRDPVALSLAAEVAAALVLGAYLLRQRRSRGTGTPVIAAPAAS